jgi:uncharacterized protein
MKLHEHIQARMNLISRYGAGEILINGQRITVPCIVAPDHLQTEWITAAGQLTATALEPLWALAPRIVLLGGDSLWQTAGRALHSACLQHQAGLEVMDLGGAARTYNVLAQEDRPVVALLCP